MSKSILVTGATGKQGGAVVRHLLKHNFNIKALTRKPASEAARNLRNMGVDIVAGDMEKAGDLESALAGCWGFFSVQNFWEKGVGYDGEIRQARNLLQAARATGVQYFVQSSIANCDRGKGIRHFESKASVEALVRTSGIDHTILRTVMFMENFTDKRYEKVFLPVLRGILPSDLKIHLLTVEDIGAATAALFTTPELYRNKTINLASDKASVQDVARWYQEVFDRPAPTFSIPGWVTWFINRDMRRQLIWNKGKESWQGWQFPLAETRQLVSRPTSVKEYFQSIRALTIESTL